MHLWRVTLLCFASFLQRLCMLCSSQKFGWLCRHKNCVCFHSRKTFVCVVLHSSNTCYHAVAVTPQTRKYITCHHGLPGCQVVVALLGKVRIGGGFVAPNA